MRTRFLLKVLGGFSVLAGIDSIALVIYVDSVLGKLIYAIIGVLSVAFGAFILALLPPSPRRNS